MSNTRELTGRRCELSGVGVQYGNKVSHSQRKTRRRFEPNLRNVVYFSEITGQNYSLRVLARMMRTIDKNGGFDAFMLKAKDEGMSLKAKRIKRAIRKKQEELAA
jgi:large subunit ribosomal protein L28